MWLHHPQHRKGDTTAAPLSSLGPLESPEMSINDTYLLITVPLIKPPSTSFKAAPKEKILKRQRSRYSLFKNAVKEDIKNYMSEILSIVLTKLLKVGLLLDFCNFLRLIKANKFPLHNISVLFFIEDVHWYSLGNTVKILKIGTPEIITIIVLQLEQLDFTVQYCV